MWVNGSVRVIYIHRLISSKARREVALVAPETGLLVDPIR
jgi:hypothetical protein